MGGEGRGKEGGRREGGEGGWRWGKMGEGEGGSEVRVGGGKRGKEGGKREGRVGGGKRGKGGGRGKLGSGRREPRHLYRDDQHFSTLCVCVFVCVCGGGLESVMMKFVCRRHKLCNCCYCATCLRISTEAVWQGAQGIL